jgi:hypothetical protein
MKNRYSLFLNYPSGLKHCHLYDSLSDISEELEIITEDENLPDKTPTAQELETWFYNNEDFADIFSSGLWYHIQDLHFFRLLGKRKKKSKHDG